MAGLALVSSASSHAGAAIIGFDTLAGTGQVVGSVVEDGFAYSPGPTGGLFGDFNYGNPSPEVQGIASLGGGTLVIRRETPTLRFSFKGFDIAQRDSRPHVVDAVTVEGYLNGAFVASESFTTLPADPTCCVSGSYRTAAPSAGLLGAALDEVRILLPGASTPDVFFLMRVDNVDLTEEAPPNAVSEPATTVLIGAGLYALLSRRRIALRAGPIR